MRTELVMPGAGVMSYEIRNIVNVAEKLQKHGVKINWENIGDPIVKGEEIPLWMKEIVAKAAMDNETWGYCHTRGVLATREFICELTNKRGGAQITPDDILFFNGLGDAILMDKIVAGWPKDCVVMEHGWEPFMYRGRKGHNNLVGDMLNMLEMSEGWGHLKFGTNWDGNQHAYDATVDLVKV